jgi:hypothetical protein
MTYIGIFKSKNIIIFVGDWMRVSQSQTEGSEKSHASFIAKNLLAGEIQVYSQISQAKRYYFKRGSLMGNVHYCGSKLEKKCNNWN